MGRRQKREKSSITVHVVDMKKAIDKVYEEDKAELGDEVIGLDTNARKWGYVETPKGIYLLDYEACGPGGSEDPLTPEGNKVKLPLYRTMESAMDMTARVSIDVDADFVRGLEKVGEENFADFVRTFGDRLESNFSNWNRHLEKEINGGQSGRESQAQEAQV